MHDFSAAPPPSRRSLLTPAATIPGKPMVKAPIPPAWSSRRREITADRCRLSLSDRFISPSPEHEWWLSPDPHLIERVRFWQGNAVHIQHHLLFISDYHYHRPPTSDEVFGLTPPHSPIDRASPNQRQAPRARRRKPT